MTTVVTSMKLTEGYKDENPVLFIGEGKIIDEQWQNRYADFTEFFYGGNVKGNQINSYTWKEALDAYTGFTFVSADESIYEDRESMEIISTMPCYPDYGSIRVVGDITVVKFSEE